MATIDYKEKYEQALERARQFSEKPYLEDSAGIVEYIFPELRESEDERIRKELIKFVKSRGGFKQEYIAWLEKQGEQKPVQETEPTPIFKIGDILKREGKDYTFRVDRIQGGYYHCDRNYGAFFPIKEQDNWELIEHKPAWSEEDDENLNWFEKFFRAESVIAEGKDIPQDRYLWFKNLKGRVQPQSQWKPSDEQMVALYEETQKSNRIKDDRIVSLYNDLKKLKEE